MRASILTAMARRPTRFDYVIIGAGSAGCTLAARLSEDPGCSVLLLEAGGWDRDPLIHIPLGWGRILLRRLHDWGYFAEPAEPVGMRSVECARGKVVGGSSSTNAMAYVRGHRADYDRWAGYGLPDWSFDRVLPYFRRQESWEGGADAFRGGDGPLTTQRCRYRDPLVDASLVAAAQAGLPPFDDYNGAEQEGFGLWQTTIRNGRRCSAAVAYLHPALRRPNLHVSTRSMVHRVLFDGDRATGVAFRRGHTIQRVHAAGEVILCGGVINSPQVLMLSGIGAAGALRRHGIPVRVDLPGVGENYQDHMSAEIALARSVPGPLHDRMRLDRIVGDLGNAYFRGRGIANDVPGGLMAFLRSGPEQPHPDIQLILSSAPLTARPYLRPFVKPYADAFAIRVVGLRPHSRGRITLASAAPEAAPRIEANLLADARDLEPIRAALRIARDILAQPALAAFAGRELSPGRAVRSDSELDAYVRSTALTLHHPAGSCRMGAEDDGMAVVDAALRVRGTRNLRVVDASVMPDLVSGNINAAVVMIAEKAADLIRRTPPG